MWPYQEKPHKVYSNFQLIPMLHLGAMHDLPVVHYTIGHSVLFFQMLILKVHFDISPSDTAHKHPLRCNDM